VPVGVNPYGYGQFVGFVNGVNTPPGTNVSVQPPTGGVGIVTVTYSIVSQGGNTTVATSASGPPPPTGFSLGTPPTFYDIATTAMFTSPVTVCITYNPAEYADQELTLFHYESGSWINVTTSLNTATHVICGSVSSLSPFVVLQPTALQVTIDIKPGTFPNSINLGSGGTVPVAILSTSTFDARTVDPLSIALASASVKLKGKGTPMTSFQDVNGDGRLDLVVHVTTESLQLSATDTQAILNGRTFDGQRLRGTDSVRVVP